MGFHKFINKIQQILFNYRFYSQKMSQIPVPNWCTVWEVIL